MMLLLLLPNEFYYTVDLRFLFITLNILGNSTFFSLTMPFDLWISISLASIVIHAVNLECKRNRTRKNINASDYSVLFVYAFVLAMNMVEVD